jgi:hypothetical protein
LRSEGTMRVEVQSYSGFKANERPLQFCLNGRSYQVVQLCDQWLGPESSYFKVLADDRNFYIFEYKPASDAWNLASFRSGSAGR